MEKDVSPGFLLLQAYISSASDVFFFYNAKSKSGYFNDISYGEYLLPQHLAPSQLVSVGRECVILSRRYILIGVLARQMKRTRLRYNNWPICML